MLLLIVRNMRTIQAHWDPGGEKQGLADGFNRIGALRAELSGPKVLGKTHGMSNVIKKCPVSTCLAGQWLWLGRLG